jgi:MGT family glycosyltransferase
MPEPRSFLFTTFEGGGALPPVLGIARRLLARGHRVRIMSEACNRADALAAGADFVAWTRAPSRATREPGTEYIRDWAQPTPQEGMLHGLDALIVGPALAHAEDVMEELAREPADLVVCSDLMLGVPMACEARGQRVVVLAANISMFPLPGIPPVGPGLPPARTEEDRALHAAVTEGTHALLDSRLPRLNLARAALGLRPLTRLVDQLEVASRTLLATARAFDFAPEVLPPGVDYLGPELEEAAWAGAWHSPFLPHDRRPLALVSFSTTFQNHGGALQRVIDAIAGLNIRAVVTLGGSVPRGALRGAANVVLMDKAPHRPIMAEASLVVTHGGHGTVMKALAHGRPMLVLPHGRDQFDNAARVAERGAGLSLPPDSGVAEIRAALSRLLEEPAFTGAAMALGAAVVREAEVSPAVAILEDEAAPRACCRAA